MSKPVHARFCARRWWRQASFDMAETSSRAKKISDDTTL